MQEKSIEQIKEIIKITAESILDAMNVKGLGRKMVNNQLELYLLDEANDLDIELAYYKMLEQLKKFRVF